MSGVENLSILCVKRRPSVGLCNFKARDNDQRRGDCRMDTVHGNEGQTRRIPKVSYLMRCMPRDRAWLIGAARLLRRSELGERVDQKHGAN